MVRRWIEAYKITESQEVKSFTSQGNVVTLYKLLEVEVFSEDSNIQRGKKFNDSYIVLWRNITSVVSEHITPEDIFDYETANLIFNKIAETFEFVTIKNLNNDNIK